MSGLAGRIDDNLEAQLCVLLDKQAIYEVIARYCRGIDRLDRDLIDAAYHPDAIDEHGFKTFVGAEIADEFIGNVRQLSKNIMHALCNVLIEVEGDVAYSEAYMLSYTTMERERKESTAIRGVRWVDRFERRKGEWRIAHRILVDEFTRMDEVLGTHPVSMHNPSKRSKEDPVYQLRARYERRQPSAGGE